MIRLFAIIILALALFALAWVYMPGFPAFATQKYQEYQSKRKRAYLLDLQERGEIRILKPL